MAIFKGGTSMTTPEKLEAERKSFIESMRDASGINLAFADDGLPVNPLWHLHWKLWQAARSQPQQSAPRVVSDEDVERAIEAYDKSYCKVNRGYENTQIAMRAALESLAPAQQEPVGEVFGPKAVSTMVALERPLPPGTLLYASPQPAQPNAAAEDSLRAILKDRNYRTDGDLNALIDRLAHMCAGDRDYIAMNEKWHVENASQSKILAQKVEAMAATIGKHLAIDAGFESTPALQKYLYGVMKYLDQMTNDHGGNDLLKVPTSASSEYIAGFHAGAHATRLDQQPSVLVEKLHKLAKKFLQKNLIYSHDVYLQIEKLIAEHGKGGAE
jgi:hypothetical protein